MDVKRSLHKGGCLLALLLLMVLSGCGREELTLNPQELYCLPKLPTEYTELDHCIQKVLDSGAEYAAPTAGTHVQAVQLVDLDGDGCNEAVACFRNQEEERPLKIYLFEEQDDSYRTLGVIEGSGTSIYSIAYQDLNGDGWMELVIGWRAGTEIQALSVHSLSGGKPRELLRTNYVRYAIADLDQDQQQELVVFRGDDEGAGVAERYVFQEENLQLQGSARLSMNMAQLSQQGRVHKGFVQKDLPALFVTGVELSTTAITDILTLHKGELKNLVLSDVTGISTETAPFRGIYPMDLNDDGVTEVPCPMEMPAWDDGEEAPYQQIDWHNFDQLGQPKTVLSTYHAMEDGWYFRLSREWEGRLAISRSTQPNEAVVTFLRMDQDGKVLTPFLRISALSGARRDIQAVQGNRFVLSRQAETTYTAELLEGNQNWKYGLTEDEVRSSFSLITREWDDN